MTKGKLILLLAGAAVTAAVVSQLLRQGAQRSAVQAPAVVELNSCTASELLELGLDQDSVERVMENRPYRNKLELVSRMILGEGMYQDIHHQIGIERPYEPVKVAF
ncbi:MAG: hypothetical protein H0X25_07635 [Acidobacteriales bacterium]|nr:hypothetical protein [Terriglobales bacterium]